jgi:hypothetical protein
MYLLFSCSGSVIMNADGTASVREITCKLSFPTAMLSAIDNENRDLVPFCLKLNTGKKVQ